MLNKLVIFSTIYYLLRQQITEGIIYRITFIQSLKVFNMLTNYITNSLYSRSTLFIFKKRE